MSQYSTSLRTQHYEPSSHIANKMTTFRLDKNSLYMPNMRIINLGYFSNSAALPSQLAGHYACIQRISLMDGAKTLSTLRNANRWLSFENQLGDNQHKLNVLSPQCQAAIGYILRPDDKVDYPPPPAGNAVSVDVASEVLTSTLDLRRVFPVLNQMSSGVDTAVFTQLRVEIEYVADSTSVGLSDKSKTVTIQEPTLLADMVVDPSLAAAMRKAQPSVVPFYEIENDVLVVPTKTGTNNDTPIVQSTTSTLNGFDNKVVGRVAILKLTTDPADNYETNARRAYGPFSSRNYHREVLQIRKNGQNMFPSSGISNDGYKLQLLHDAWGNVCIPPFGAAAGVGLAPPAGATNGSGTPPTEAGKQSNRIGASDYYGFSVEDRVNQLSLTFERSCTTTDVATYNWTNNSITMFVFGEVRKSIVIKGGSYECVYA